MIESVTMRMRGHAEHDPFDYVPKSMLEEWEKKDPVERIQKRMLDHGLSKQQIVDVAERAEAEISEAVAYALTLPGPDPSEALRNIFFQHS